METDNGKRGVRAMLMAVAIATMSAGSFSCDDKDDSPAQQANYTFSGNASGSQVVPSVAGTGTGTITGTYNPNTRVLNYTNTWSGLTGANWWRFLQWSGWRQWNCSWIALDV